MTKPYSTPSRVNARIDKVAEEQLRYVTEHTRMNVTEALKSAIALMYEKVSREQAAPAEIARRLDFIGMAASGSSGGSENYKREVAAAISAKIKPRAHR
jgi:hypothetical protein